ncbi:MAG TPA: outer membrane protein assembly factor BamD [Gemmatimonadaceae bacterium]|nr:outer membrane protein assembly factor BamD [Gemmatimonadaceae bacterium]
MPQLFWRRAAAGLLLAFAAVACRPDFKLQQYHTHEELFRAGLRQFDRHKWDNAVAAFEKLTLELPARDTLLPRSYWYLASSHERQGEHLLAAQSFSKLVETFPDDSLADDAALAAARSYKELWRKPSLDPTYGETALATYNTLIGLYPNSPLIPVAEKEIGELNNWFAIKNYDAGMYYFRRKAYDSAIIYFKDVMAKWPNAPKTKDAALRLVEAYKAIHYREDASDMCTQLRRQYPKDGDVRDVCEGVPNQPATASQTPIP